MLQSQHFAGYVEICAMPSQDDIDATQELLRTHRQTVQLLLEQQAKLGVYTPPGVLIGISEARQAMSQAKAALRDWGITVEDLPSDQASEPAESPLPGASAAPIGGDTIIGVVGAGARGVAIGKQITQAISETSPADERHTIEALVQQCTQVLQAANLNPAIAPVAEFQLRLLAGELGKVESQSTPSASTISQVGGWLLDTVPALKPALTALFGAPAVRRVLQRADAPLGSWLGERFAG